MTDRAQLQTCLAQLAQMKTTLGRIMELAHSNQRSIREFEHRLLLLEEAILSEAEDEDDATEATLVPSEDEEEEQPSPKRLRIQIPPLPEPQAAGAADGPSRSTTLQGPTSLLDLSGRESPRTRESRIAAFNERLARRPEGNTIRDSFIGKVPSAFLQSEPSGTVHRPRVVYDLT